MLENSVKEVSCPDNINSVYCLLSGHETLSTEFSNATEIHCIHEGYVTVYCSCVGKLFSHSLQSLVPMRIHSRTKYAYGHETLQGMGK